MNKINLTNESIKYCEENKKNECKTCKIRKLCLDLICTTNLKEYKTGILKINNKVKELIND